MASLVLGAVGAFFGSFFGPVGTSIGWAIGSAIGHTFEPNQQNIGPRLNDMKVQASGYGQMIPIISGSMRCAGNVIWSTDKIETAKTAHQGKGGGGGVDTTTFSYSVNCAISICKGEIWKNGRQIKAPIVGIRRIWANGRLIYSAASDASIETQAESQKQASTYVVYTGSKTQLPDPTMESALGVGNVSAHRGLAYVVVTGLQLADFGNQLPNFEFEVVESGTSGTVTTSSEYVPCALKLGEYAWGINNGFAVARGSSDIAHGHGFHDFEFGGLDLMVAGGMPDGYGGKYTPYHTSGPVLYYAFDDAENGSNDTVLVDLYDSLGNNADGAYVQPDYSEFPDSHPVKSRDISNGEYLGKGDGTGLGGHWVQRVDLVAPEPICGLPAKDPTVTGTWEAYDGNDIYCVGPDGTIIKNVSYVKLGSPSGPYLWTAYKKGVRSPGAYPTADTGPVLLQTDPRNNSTWWGAYNASVGGTGTYGVDYAVGVNEVAAPVADTHVWPVIDSTPVTLSSIVTMLCELSGLVAEKIDVSQLTDLVHGYAVTRQASARADLEQLRQAYFFDAVESDGIVKFVKRGGAAVVTIPYDDLGAHLPGESHGDPVSIQRTQEVDLPQRVAINFFNNDSDYQQGSESDSRLITESKQQLTIELAIALTTDEARQIAAKALYNAHVERSAFQLAVTRKYARYEPTDVINVVGGNATYRLRIIKKDESGPIVKFDCVEEDSTVYTSTVVSAPQLTTQTQIEGSGPTHTVFLDIPILRDVDDDPGMYVAADGLKSAWGGYGLYRSVDAVACCLRIG